MGDEGHLYNGLTEDTVKEMRELARNADYMVPNYTEAALIAGTAYKAEGLTWEEAKALLNKLHAMSQGSVIITSAKVDGEDAVAGYDAARDEYFLRTFTMVPIRFPGTGDIFSSIFMGEILNGEPLIRSVEKAMGAVKLLIMKNKDSQDTFKGIAIEIRWRCLTDAKKTEDPYHTHRSQRPLSLSPRSPRGGLVGFRQRQRRALPHGDARSLPLCRYPSLRRRDPPTRRGEGHGPLLLPGCRYDQCV